MGLTQIGFRQDYGGVLFVPVGEVVSLLQNDDRLGQAATIHFHACTILLRMA